MGGVEFAEKLAAKGGLAAAHFANEHDEALFFADAVLQVLQSLLVSGAEVEKLRVRSDVERHLRESVVALIHRLASIWSAREKARQNRVNGL